MNANVKHDLYLNNLHLIFGNMTDYFAHTFYIPLLDNLYSLSIFCLPIRLRREGLPYPGCLCKRRICEGGSLVYTTLGVLSIPLAATCLLITWKRYNQLIINRLKKK